MEGLQLSPSPNFCCHLPYTRLRELYPLKLFGGYLWKDDDEENRRAALYSLTSFYDPQSIGFMVDLLPYFFEILREDNPSFRVKEVTRVLALQLHFVLASDSMCFHESEVMDDRCID